MAIDKDCPCTMDCPDRPNCKGCERFKVYKEKKFAEYEQRQAERDFKDYEYDLYRKKFDMSVEKRKKPKRMVHHK